MKIGLLSLEPWDDVWRRNQHFAARLIRSGAVRSLIFVEPPRRGLALRARRHSPLPAIEVVTPPLLVPRRYGGHRVLSWWLRHALADIDVLWINDPVAGAGALRDGIPAVYDVTDDWREMPQDDTDRARIVAAEDTPRAAGAHDRVTFVGFTERVEDELARMLVLVHASTVPEPFGQVIVEGMAAGLTVVAAAAGGPLEIITPEVDGLVVPPGDVPALAATLRRVIADPDLRERLGASARIRAQDFNPEIIGRRVLAIYREVVALRQGVAGPRRG